MTVRKMTAEERDQLFGSGLVLPVMKPNNGSTTSKAKSGTSKKSFIQPNDEYGDGFSATLMDGPRADLFEIAGLEWTSDLHDAVWGNHNWRSLLEECENAEIIQTGSQDHAPGMSDVFFWVAIADPKKFSQELRTVMLAAARNR
jgi:hypothetical protein